MPDTVLVVGSSKLVADLLKMRLEMHGYAVQRASTGEEAWALIDAHPPDLLVLDEQLDGMDSYELCRRVRAKAPLDGICIIMLTSSDDPQGAHDPAAGVSRYINKDADLLSLPHHIRSLLERG